jgi:hypothetical protein
MQFDGDNPLRRVVTAALEDLGPVESWKSPTGYPNALALCVIDSIFSLGIRYEIVENVVRNYVSMRSQGTRVQGLTDGPAEFSEWCDSMGSKEAAAEALGSRNRTSSKGAY